MKSLRIKKANNQAISKGIAKSVTVRFLALKKSLSNSKRRELGTF
jgi:hypothetical protein